MERTVRGSGRQAYASAVTDLWNGLGTALARLERIAESPGEWLADDVGDELPTLQYQLHAAAELAVGIAPPRGGETVHAELVAALAHARDATAELAGAIEEDDGVAQALLPEWRGALFRVRLARVRALERSTLPFAADQPGRVVTARPRRSPARPTIGAALATALVVGGGLLFTAGAVLAAWPVWAAGILLFAGGFVLYHP